MDALKALYHKVSPGGFVIVDDYHDWSSCRDATSDFRKENNIKDEIKEIDGHGVYWKVS